MGCSGCSRNADSNACAWSRSPDAVLPETHNRTGLSIRLDGDYHRLSEAGASFDPSSVWGGALDVVFALPGVGLTPYLLGGIGRYRVSSGPAGMAAPVIYSGFNGGFGVGLGSLAFGGFVEIRYVQLEGGSGVRYIPLTVGLRL